MKVTNVLNNAETLYKDKEALTVESVRREIYEQKAVRLTMDADGIKMSVIVNADELQKAIENAVNN